MLKRIQIGGGGGSAGGDNKKQVKVPRQIRLKTEFFVGWGMEELIKTLIVELSQELLLI